MSEHNLQNKKKELTLILDVNMKMYRVLRSFNTYNSSVVFRCFFLKKSAKKRKELLMLKYCVSSKKLCKVTLLHCKNWTHLFMLWVMVNTGWRRLLWPCVGKYKIHLALLVFYTRLRYCFHCCFLSCGILLVSHVSLGMKSVQKRKRENSVSVVV